MAAKSPLPPVRIARQKPGASYLGLGPVERVERAAVWASAGLAVTRSVPASKGYAVTHVASGYAVTRNVRTQRDAVKAARELLAAGDWTVARSRLTRELQVAAKAILARLRAEGVL